MKIADVLTSPWMITPAKLLEIQEIYRTHLRGEKIDTSIIEAATGRTLNNEPKPYEVVDGVAIVSIEGVLAKKMSLFTAISGGTSTQAIAQEFKQAMDDQGVNAVLLYVDSPGGTVDGNLDLVNAIYQARQAGTKPIVAYTDGLVASAAYWIAAAAGAIFISNSTAEIGSIGVVATHTDYSRHEEQRGIKTTEVYAGKYKRIYSQTKPLDGDGLAYIQGQVDHLKTIFVNSVAEMREISATDTEGNLTEWAESKVFIGQQAEDSGLVDGTLTRDELINELAAGRGFSLIRTARADRLTREILKQKRRAENANDSTGN